MKNYSGVKEGRIRWVDDARSSSSVNFLNRHQHYTTIRPFCFFPLSTFKQICQMGRTLKFKDLFTNVFGHSSSRSISIPKFRGDYAGYTLLSCKSLRCSHMDIIRVLLRPAIVALYK